VDAGGVGRGVKASANARGQADSGTRCSEACGWGAACVGGVGGGVAGAKRLLSEFAALGAWEILGTPGML